MSGNGGQFLCLAAKLKGDPVDLSAGAVGVDADALPLALVDFLRFLNEVYQTAALANTHLAQLTAGGNIQFSAFTGNRTEGAKRNQRFRFFRGYKIVIDNQFSHIGTSLQHFLITQERI